MKEMWTLHIDMISYDPHHVDPDASVNLHITFPSQKEMQDAFVQYQGSQGIYLLLDVVPCYHNYSFQETQAGKSPVLAEDVVKEFSTCKAKYILSRGNDGLIRDILDTKYEPLPSRKCKNATYTLYKRLED